MFISSKERKIHIFAETLQAVEYTQASAAIESRFLIFTTSPNADAKTEVVTGTSPICSNAVCICCTCIL